jgi:hypothetical protein
MCINFCTTSSLASNRDFFFLSLCSFPVNNITNIDQRVMPLSVSVPPCLLSFFQCAHCKAMAKGHFMVQILLNGKIHHKFVLIRRNFTRFFNYLSMALQPFFGPWSLFSYLILYTVGRASWKGNHLIARPLPTQRTTQTKNKRTPSFMF